MSSDGGACWINGLKQDYQEIFVEEWSPYVGAILMILIIIGLMVSGMFWGIYGGLKLWGDYINNMIGIGPLVGVPQKLETLLMHRMSLMNMTLVLGAFCAALLSRQFLINRPPRLEYVWAVMGGCLMGLGATLAGGCTSGGFFTPVLHSSPAGWVMWVGLIAGAILGLKALLWTLENIEWGMQAPRTLHVPPALLQASAGQSVELTAYTHALYDARELAIERLQDEAEDLGATGVVGVTVSESGHSWRAAPWNIGNAALQTGELIELFVIGTAVVPTGAHLDEVGDAELVYSANDVAVTTTEGGGEE